MQSQSAIRYSARTKSAILRTIKNRSTIVNSITSDRIKVNISKNIVDGNNVRCYNNIARRFNTVYQSFSQPCVSRSPLRANKSSLSSVNVGVSIPSSSGMRTSSSSAIYDDVEPDAGSESFKDLMETETPYFGESTLSSLLMEDYDDEEQSSTSDDYSRTTANNYFDDDDISISSRKQNKSRREDMASLLSLFEATAPPAVDSNNNLNDDLHALQLWIECESQRETVSQYEAILQSARERQDYTSLKPVRRYLLKWYKDLRNAIEEEQRSYFTDSRGKKDRVRYGAYLCTLQPEKMAVILAHIGITHALSQGGHGAKLAQMAIHLGDAVEAEVNVQRLLRRKVRQRDLNNTVNENDETDINSDENSISDECTNDIASDSDEDNNLSEDLIATPEWMYGASHLARFVEEANKANMGKKTRMRIRMANRRALRLLQEKNEPWSDMIKAKLGAALVQILLDHAKLDNGDPAFTYEKKWVGWNQTVGHVSVDENFYKMIVEDKYDSLAPYSTRHKPMVTPPRDWLAPSDGGYYALQVNIIRKYGCQTQKNALHQADLDLVYSGLNSLGRVPWKINKRVLDVAQACWDRGIVLGDIPSRVDFDLPHEPVRPEEPTKEMFENKDSEEFREAAKKYMKYREDAVRYRKMYQKNMDLRSLRCSALLKLNQAEKFKDFERIYFPYNLDFRGRAYPVPPHLSNVGSDLCRGMLTFSETKPLGERGFYWLKVHIANLAGNDKISFDERAAFTDNNIDVIRDSVENPLDGERWWMSCDDPFQALAACIEVINAIDSGDPQNFECSLPVHMDGSCNGLQHYAALGRDKIGGTAVNLCPCDKPQDVYSGVMKEVIARVEEEAKKILDYDWNDENLTGGEKTALKNNQAAKLVNGLIDRGVVKRTVMTSVYGVTFIGAKQQIHEKIEEKLVEKGVDVDEIESEINAASTYLASVTMDVMGDLFQGARQTMNWLATCARLISSQGTPIAWVTPIGLPVVQPYRQAKPYTIVTLVQHMVLSNNTDNLPIHKGRQVTAFPPNYVHSLDSSHMILTALEMEKKGLTFSAVHDSFWTHACDVDILNETLRECFVDLYDKPLLEELKKTWELRYPSIRFPKLPKRGTLDLNEVKTAPYFFQ